MNSNINQTCQKMTDCSKLRILFPLYRLSFWNNEIFWYLKRCIFWFNGQISLIFVSEEKWSCKFLEIKKFEKGRQRGAYINSILQDNKNLKIDVSEDFSSMRRFLTSRLPPLFKICRNIKNILSLSFCTKNEVDWAIASICILIWIWIDTQAKSMIFFDYEIPFLASFWHFLAKNEFLKFKTLYILI